MRTEVLHRVNEERNIFRTLKTRKDNWIGHILRRSCLLRHVIGGEIGRRIGVTGRRGRRRKQLLGDRKEKRGYCILKDNARDRNVWRTSFGRGLWTCRKTDWKFNCSVAYENDAVLFCHFQKINTN